MEYYSLTAPATSRRGAAGFIKVYLSECDSEVNDQSHDALILWSAARMKRAKQTGASVREYVEKAEYEEMRFRSLWVKA